MSAPIRSVPIKVVDIIGEWDMRKMHPLRFHRKTKNLRQGSCVIAFNRKQSMARIIDWAGGVHTYYAEKGEIFDMESLRELVNKAFYVDLKPGVKATHRASDLWAA